VFIILGPVLQITNVDSLILILVIILKCPNHDNFPYLPSPLTCIGTHYIVLSSILGVQYNI